MSFDAHGVLQRKQYTLRKVKWEQTTRRPRCITGREFKLCVLEETVTPTGPLADSLFRLERLATPEAQ